MTLIVVVHGVSKGEDGHGANIRGVCNGGGDSYATATVGCKKWHIGVGIGHHNVERHFDYILYRGWAGEMVPNQWEIVFKRWRV